MSEKELPNELLAKIVVEELLNAQLLLPTKANDLLNSLGSGKVTEEDWRLFAELSVDAIRSKDA